MTEMVQDVSMFVTVWLICFACWHVIVPKKGGNSK